MSETLKKLDLDVLKDVNGGQIFYARRGNQTEYFVPWAAENDVNLYERAWDAKTRAEDLVYIQSSLSATPCGLQYVWQKLRRHIFTR